MANQNKPWAQGKLDGLCGVYAVINASLIWSAEKPDKNRDRKLLRLLCNSLTSDLGVGDVIFSGIGLRQVGTMIDLAANELGTSVRYKLAFSKNPDDYINDYWDVINKYLQAPRSLAIVWISQIHHDASETAHWTVIRAVSDKRLTLFDSDGWNYLNRSQLAADNSESGKVCPWATRTYLISPQ